MRASAFPQWAGFEIKPHGCLLEQVIDMSGDMGFAYERSCEFYKDFHVHDRLMLIFPRGSSAMEVGTRNSKRPLRVDSKSILLVPKGLEHDDEGISSIYDTTAFYPSDQLIYSTLEKLGIAKNITKETLNQCLLINRTKRLDQLVQDFFFEKVVTGNSVDKQAIEYLGRKILEDTFKQIFSKSDKKDSRGFQEGSVVTQALRYIETNLFEDLQLDRIAKQSGASVSTLLRKFKVELGLTPYIYIRSRRLEEAYQLLLAGQYSVSEVALLVGYENLGAFTDAFKEKYKKLPSHINQA